ncbi:MAG: hypothetical protein JWQ97_2923 [Phenylobacterium sp.]|nr:hypothetical protein [Phenylobacterium sp.]
MARFVTDDGETETAARVLLELAAVQNSTGRQQDTVSIALQLLLAPLRYDQTPPSVVLGGIAAGLGALTSMAQPEPSTRALLLAVLFTLTERAANSAAATGFTVTPPPASDRGP